MVVINREGWFLTAGHIVKHLRDLLVSTTAVGDYDAAVAQITDDASLTPQQRKKKRKQLKRPGGEAIRNSSVWWGRDNVNVKQFVMLDDGDIAAGQLEPFDPSWVSTYPVIINPTSDLRIGTSLCRPRSPD